MQILPLFSAAVVVCSFCCCFVSTKTDVGKLLTSTMVDNKIAKISTKLYFKNQAISFSRPIEKNVQNGFVFLI